MTKKYLTYLALPAVGILLLGGTALAHGWGGGNATPEQITARYQQQFSSEATMLGLSVDDVKQAWASGKSLQQLATDHGISAADLQKKMADARAAKLKAELQTLVTQGVITQAQADQRLTFMTTKPAAGMHPGFRGRHSGF